MGYRIQYGKTTRMERVASPRASKKVTVVKTVIILGVLMFAVFLGRLGFLNFLIPGDKEVTKAAFHAMLDDVREGKDVKTAITAFCAEILDNAEYEE